MQTHLPRGGFRGTGAQLTPASLKWRRLPVGHCTSGAASTSKSTEEVTPSVNPRRRRLFKQQRQWEAQEASPKCAPVKQEARGSARAAVQPPPRADVATRIARVQVAGTPAPGSTAPKRARATAAGSASGSASNAAPAPAPAPAPGRPRGGSGSDGSSGDVGDAAPPETAPAAAARGRPSSNRAAAGASARAAPGTATAAASTPPPAAAASIVPKATATSPPAPAAAAGSVPSRAPARLPGGLWSLFKNQHVQRGLKRLRGSSGAELASIALYWADEWARGVDDWARGEAQPPRLKEFVASNAGMLAQTVRVREDGTKRDARGKTLGELGLLLSQQELADVAWALAHFGSAKKGRGGSSLAGEFEAAMALPFRMLPARMRDLRLDDFVKEVELRQDTVYLDGGERAVTESRLTGWQSNVGASFKYSGKEMEPGPGGMTPRVKAVRDKVKGLTGIEFDSVLVNYYPDGRSGMRFHADPLYGMWEPETAVVSIGQARRFIFREASDITSRWEYTVSNGDVVYMWGDCQERLQHSVKVEREDRGAAELGPRMSLVFKRRVRDPAGGGPATGESATGDPATGESATRESVHVEEAGNA
ncbi:hypothetical protein FOA52_003027 [Chlamydomonas sp. UWO 241]|nr:hypothetical protein FOA52_003027 [Chlamydomonas sp. UWO 241]